jgi:hypothetical protein
MITDEMFINMLAYLPHDLRIWNLMNIKEILDKDSFEYLENEIEKLTHEKFCKII